MVVLLTYKNQELKYVVTILQIVTIKNVCILLV